MVVMSRLVDQLGRVLGSRYRLVAPIGTGSSAQVFLADDVTLRRRVAVKVLHPALADDEAFLRRFRAEARAAAALSHPNLMAVYDWGEDDGPYLVMEYLGGGSLRAVLDRGRTLTTSQALVVGLDAARALDVAHRRGFAHRDIKPANLLFGEDERLRIADFGLARALSEAAWTEPGDGLVGTARYAAPEQGTRARIDGKADVYALALVLIEAVTGEVPLTAESGIATLALRADLRVPVPSELGPLAPALERAGHPDPAERPDAAELGRALLGAARALERPAPLPLVGAIDLDLADDGEAPDPTLLPPPARAVVEERRPSLFDDLADADPPPRRQRRGATSARAARRRKAERSTKRRWPKVVLAIVLLAALIGGAVVGYLQLQVPTAEVPSVDARPEAEALAALATAQVEAEEALDWEVQVERQFNDGVVAGVVISQDPAPGTSLADNGRVTIVVSDGPPPRDLPALALLDQGQAGAALTEADLVLGTVTGVFDEDVPTDQVITWSAGGAERPPEVPKGTAVDLVLSNGPAPRSVPDVGGQSEGQARAAIEAQRLRVEVVKDHHDDVDAGDVIGTSPASGSSIARDELVTVVVSLGPDLVTVPDVAGLSLSEAAAALRDADLVPDQVVGPAEGAPFRTDVPAGERIRRGTSVDIFLE